MPIQQNETERLRVLDETGIVDTPSEQFFDDIALLATQICHTPLAMITFVDGTRQWFKARVGLSERETPRDVAFCAHAILSEGIFEVPDSHDDERFTNNTLVRGGLNVRFYAGAPLITRDGFALGTVCAIDHVPRSLSAEEREGLLALSRLVVGELERRRSVSRP